MIFFRHSIIIICHFGHFSFCTLFLNVARYRLLAISVPSNFTFIDVRFFWKKTINTAVVGNVPGKAFFLFFNSPAPFVWPFSEAKVKFSGTQILVENAKKYFFFPHRYVLQWAWYGIFLIRQKATLRAGLIIFNIQNLLQDINRN